MKRTAGVLVLIAAALAAFVVVPGPFAALGSSVLNQPALQQNASEALVPFWLGGGGDPQHALQELTAYWARYHLAKALCAALALVLLLVLHRDLRRADDDRVGFLVARLLVAGLALLALLLVMANVQGALAPLASLLSLVAPERRRLLLDAPPPPVIVGDFVRYHGVLAVLAAVAFAVAAASATYCWVRRRRAPSQAGRRPSRIEIALLVLSAAFFAVVVAANLSTVLNPQPALMSFLHDLATESSP